MPTPMTQPGPNSQILTVAQMRAAEEELIEAGIGVDALMLTAGTGAADWVFRLAWPRPVTVLCGPGNNGGDGYVIAESLRRRGLDVLVVAPLEPATQAARNARQAYGGPIIERADGRRGDTLVDCLFGSGLARPLPDRLLAILNELAASHPHRVAIDLPSGVDGDTGVPLNGGLPGYDLTIALGAWKFAHWLMPSRARMGDVRLVDIGIGPVPASVVLSRRPRLDPPDLDAHKYSRGFLGVVGGAMPGAGVLAAQAAMRSGAGYVKLFAEAPLNVPPDLVVETGELIELLGDERLDALVVGPGLGRDGLALERLEMALARELPTVVDGDALTLLRPEMIAGRKERLVLTPHAGELEYLYQACEIEPGDRIERLRALAIDTGSIVVAKGPDTMIVDPIGLIRLAGNAGASSWLSTAGTGDVLAGLVGSRIAAGTTLWAAAEQAVWLHARAAQLAGPAFAASDLIHNISTAYAEFL